MPVVVQFGLMALAFLTSSAVVIVLEVLGVLGLALIALRLKQPTF